MGRITLGVILGLGLAIAVLSVASARLGPTVESLNTAQDLDGASINTPIQISFTEPMNPRSVERYFSVEPRVTGDFNWSGNQLLFTPRKSLPYSRRFTVRIGDQAVSAAGKRLYRSFTGSFTTQSPHLIYLGAGGAQQNRLVLSGLNGKSRIIGPDDGSVTDYSISTDHSQLVFVRKNSSSSRANELWLLNLSDDTTRRIYYHPDWTISQPRISPDNRYVVFLATNVLLCQKYYGCTRDKSGPIIYLLDLQSHHASQFRPGSTAPLTYFIDFSPAGQVAYTDLGSALTLAPLTRGPLVHIPDLGNSPEFSGFDPPGDKAAFVGQTPSSSGGDILVYLHGKYLDVSKGIYDSSTPSFSMTGRQIAYVAYRGELGIEPLYGINVYDFTARSTRRLTSESRWSDWTPEWSLDDRYIAFVRSQPQEAMYMGSGDVWVIKSDGTDAHPLGGTGSNVQWAS